MDVTAMSAVSSVAQVTPQELSGSIVGKVDAFINEIHQLGLNINNDIMHNASMLDLEEHVNRYSAQTALASKVANSLVKSINALTNT